MKNLKLKHILKYKNKYVVDRFANDFNLSQREAQFLFQDCLTFLWLSNRHNFYIDTKSEVDFPLRQFGLHSDIYAIDEMWHTFVMFTYDYATFCEKYFGQFLHHQPEIKVKKKLKAKISKRQHSLDQAMMSAYMTFIKSEIGEKMFDRWFNILPRKYSRLTLNQNRLKASQ